MTELLKGKLQNYLDLTIFNHLMFCVFDYCRQIFICLADRIEAGGGGVKGFLTPAFLKVNCLNMPKYRYLTLHID